MRWCSLAALAILMLAIAIPAAARQRHRWWQSTEMKADLGLTDEQSERLEDIYQSTLPDLRNLMQSLNEEEAGLSELIDAMEADEWEITLQIDKVESARSALSKTRILMLYRMHRELSQDQRGDIEKMERQQRSAAASLVPNPVTRPLVPWPCLLHRTSDFASSFSAWGRTNDRR